MKNKYESPSFIMLKIISWPFKSFFRIFIVVLIVGLYIYQAVSVDQLAREIRMLEVEYKNLQNENESLAIEIEQLTNINRIQKLAKEKYGLINAGNQLESLVIKKFEKKQQPVESKEIQLAGVN